MSAISIPVDGPDQVGEARRAAVTMANALGFDQSAAGRIAVVVTECGTNLWKHAGSGEIVLSAIRGNSPGMQVLALDKGPGMDVEKSFRDGYSTAGSPGTGLGAVRRMSSLCDVYARPDGGSALLARFLLSPAHEPVGDPPRLDWGAVCVPVRGETACGDGYAVREFPDCALAMVVDGLGHGPIAADCAAAASAAMDALTGTDLLEAFHKMHAALRSTRGAALTLVRLDFVHRELRVAGVGNVSGFIYDHVNSHHLVSQPGIVGHDIRYVKEFTHPWPPDSYVLLYSDGISTHWSLASYDGLLHRDPSLVAGVVYRDWKRIRDDATVLVIRESAIP